MAERDGLENRCVSNGTGGSNPSPSAESIVLERSRRVRLALAVKMP